MRAVQAVRVVLVTAIAICLSVLFGTQTYAQETATVTLLHGIPGVPVDVAVDGAVVFSNFEAAQTQDLSSFAGTTLKGLEVRAAGTTDVVIGPVDFAVPSSGNWTVLAHLDAEGAPKISAFENDTASTTAGTGRLTVVHAAEAPPVDLVVGDARPIVNLANGAAQALELPTGTISGAQLAPTGGDPIIDVPAVDIVADTDLIVYAVGSLEDKTFTFYTQTIKLDATTDTTTSTSTTSSTTTTTMAPTTTTMAPTTTAPAVTEPKPTVAPPTTAAPAAGTATVTLLHGIPGVPVDVAVGGTVVIPNFQPSDTQDLSSFSGQKLTNLEVRKAGTTTAVIGPVDFDVPASGNWTVIAHLDADGAPTVSAFENDTSKTGAGDGRLVVVHAAAAPAVDLVVGTARPIVNLANGQAKPLELPAGTISGAKLAPTGADPIIDVPTVALAAGTDLIVYAVGSLADKTFTFYTQTIKVGQQDAVTTTSSTSSSTSSTTQILPPTLPPTGSGNTIWVSGLLLSVFGLTLTTLARRGASVR